MEKWKTIPGYEGKYEASDRGNIRSLNRNKTTIMRLTLTRHNYYMVTLRQNGKNVHRSVHRLIALTWIPNPNNLPEVDHINSIPSDNRLENLRWCTKEENMHNPATIEKRRQAKKRPYSLTPISEERRAEISQRLSKPIIQMDRRWNFIREYSSIKEASLSTGIHQSTISNCCRGKGRTAGDFRWKFK